MWYLGHACDSSSSRTGSMFPRCTEPACSIIFSRLTFYGQSPSINATRVCYGKSRSMLQQLSFLASHSGHPPSTQSGMYIPIKQSLHQNFPFLWAVTLNSHTSHRPKHDIHLSIASTFDSYTSPFGRCLFFFCGQSPSIDVDDVSVRVWLILQLRPPPVRHAKA